MSQVRIAAFKRELKDIGSLTGILGIIPKDFLNIVHGMDAYVRTFYLKDKQGKKRQMATASDTRLEAIHRMLQRKILSKVSVPSSMHGYRRGRSTVTHSRNHVGAAYIARFDIKDCFPSIFSGRITLMYESLGASPLVAQWLTQLTTWKQRLPLGFSTSNDIANVIMAPMVKRLEHFCVGRGLKVSFYADNIEISGGARVKDIKRQI
ncbi:MAG: reverse transcriptase domain-containing protein, partial [Elusimicrobiota bacterium]